MPAFNFQQRFAPLVESGRKPSTIRSTMRCKIGDTVQLYTGQRTKQCRKLGEGVCIGLAEITISEDDFWKIEGSIGDWLRQSRLHEQEGFMNVNEFVDFFRQRYGLPFKGYLHVWELKGKTNDEK